MLPSTIIFLKLKNSSCSNSCLLVRNSLSFCLLENVFCFHFGRIFSMGIEFICVFFFLYFFLINLKIYLFIYFWLHWVFVAAHGLSLVVVSGGYSLLWCAGFSLRWLLLLQSTGSRRTGFSSCGLWALERRLSSCGAWA